MRTEAIAEEQRRNLIEQAFFTALKLDDSDETRLRVSLAAEMLARMVDSDRFYPNAFKSAGAAKVEKELLQFASHVRALRTTLNKFHQTTIERIADAHITINAVERQIEPLVYLAEVFEALDTSDIKNQNRGRSAHRASAIASQIAYQYRIIVGKDPSITNNVTDGSRSGMFVNLVSAIFPILSVENSAVQQAEEAVGRLKEGRKSRAEKLPKPPFE
ncbi:hypothetical protein MKK75_03665 [Methylobacterium sp. J-030]|uniref:hypothetical protein n=1 Tax=Methylobacterium sp. J-030 TaxID=2836627 RepID=UPI001FBB7BD1|nr:hypothetical protein [Methylobacterium sp. J-030]MCJ2067915.1 hypothetical protein [Methylobacterium sp. J-030]